MSTIHLSDETLATLLTLAASERCRQVTVQRNGEALQLNVLDFSYLGFNQNLSFEIQARLENGAVRIRAVVRGLPLGGGLTQYLSMLAPHLGADALQIVDADTFLLFLDRILIAGPDGKTRVPLSQSLTIQDLKVPDATGALVAEFEVHRPVAAG